MPIHDTSSTSFSIVENNFHVTQAPILHGAFANRSVTSSYDATGITT